MDLNGLKRANDSFGHVAGDELIRAAADCMKSSFSEHGKVYRVGGDEFAGFAVVEDAEQAGQQIYDSIKKAAKVYNETSDIPYNITLSVGVYTMPCKVGEQIQNYVKFADQKLYQDKKNKNRVVIKPEQN